MRNNVLYTVTGLLLGFLAGYFLQEVMAERQPPRLSQGQGAVGAPFAGQTPGQASGQAPGQTPGPAGASGAAASMEQVQQLRRYVEENPDDADAVLQLANLNFDIRNWERARDLYGRYIELRPDSPNVLSDLGICMRELGEPQRALELFDRAQELVPNHWESRFNEVIVLAFDLENYDAATETLEELQQLQPGNPDVARLAAEIARRRGA